MTGRQGAAMLLSMLACNHPVPPAVPPVDAPTPYTAAQIRDSFVEGLEVQWSIQGQPHRWRVVDHDELGLSLYTVAPGSPPEVGRSTWDELRSHASFPSVGTTIEPVVLETPFGDQPSKLYTVGGDKRFWFGDATPGAPLKHTADGFSMQMTRREVVPLASAVVEVDAGVAKLWTRSEGAGGVPLLLVHGGPGMTAYPFEHGVGPMLAASRQVIYTDYRGAGRSSRPAGVEHYAFDILAADVERIRVAHGAEKIVLLGHSNGAATALTYAKTHPDRVAALILLDPLLSPADLEANVVNKALAYGVADRAEAAEILRQGGPISERFVAILDALPAGDRHAMQFASDAGRQRFDAVMEAFAADTGLQTTMTPDLILGMRKAGFFEFDAYTFVDALTMPVLVLVGAEDPEISLENARRFAVAVGGTYAELPDAGHHPFIEQPEAMATAIEAFCWEHGLRPPELAPMR